MSFHAQCIVVCCRVLSGLDVISAICNVPTVSPNERIKVKQTCITIESCEKEEEKNSSLSVYETSVVSLF